MTRVVAVSLGPRRLGPRAIRHDSRLAFELAGPDGCVCACEVENADDGPFEDEAHRANKRVRFRNRRTEVAIPADWRNFESIHYQITKAPRLWSNPARDLNVVFNHDTREYVAAMHAPNQRRGKAFARLSQRKNARYLKRVADKVECFRLGGWSGQVWGDGNAVNVYKFHEAQVVAAHAGLMWGVAIPAPGKVVKVRNVTATRKNKGDHPIVAADVTFEKGPA